MPEKWEHLDLNGFEIKLRVKSNDIEIVFKFWGPFSKVIRAANPAQFG